MTATVEVTGAASAGVAPMAEVDAQLRQAVADATTTEAMMRQAVRLSVAPETGSVALSPMQLSMDRRW
jgi:hypothetical protein